MMMMMKWSDFLSAASIMPGLEMREQWLVVVCAWWGDGEVCDGQVWALVSQHHWRHCRQDTLLYTQSPVDSNRFSGGHVGRTCALRGWAHLVSVGLTWSDLVWLQSSVLYTPLLSASWLPTITQQTLPVTTHYHNYYYYYFYLSLYT